MSSGRRIGGLLALLVTFAANSVQGLDRASANSVWVAETEGAILLASSDGSIRVEITGFSNVRAASVDVRRETVWLLGDGELAAFDLSGAFRFSVPVEAPESVHADVAVVPSTGAVWVGAQEDLVNVGPEGQPLGAFQLDGPTVTLGVDEAHSVLWVGTDRAVEARDLVTGTSVGTLPVPAGERLRDLSVDPASGRVWIASGDHVRLHEPSGEVVLGTTVRGVTRVAAVPEGGAWIAGTKETARLGADGELEPSSRPLDGRGTLEHLVVSGDGTVWAANQTTIARISSDGTTLDRISFQPPARIWDLVTNDDGTPPGLEILAPAADACLGEATPSLDLAYSDHGWGVDPATLQLFADAQPVASSCITAPTNATCRVLDPLADGERLLGATVADFAGNTGSPVERRVTIDTVAPQITIAEPADGAVVEQPEVTIAGTLSEPAELTVAGVPTTVNPDLTFSHGPVDLEEGENAFHLVAVDCAGHTAQVTLTVTHDPGSGAGLPPDPSTVAPPLDPTLPSDIHEGTRFLYEGLTPIQRDADPQALDPTRVAVVRGAVRARGGEPLAGVLVQVLGHDEYGHTVSREDGAYDLAVNGGGPLTLVYSKPGYLPVHRPVQTPWRDYVLAEDVVLLPYDDNATAVTLGSAEAQVARGSVSTDADGTRQATVLVPAGTEAELVLPDGSRQPVVSLTVRATEYTIGPRGPEAMPAPLPPTSGYTYAVELSADEAIAAGASRVELSEPVYHYVENFLGFPVGSPVPAGYYDREEAVWVPSENGRVVEVLDVLAERAVLDVDGSGQPAPASELDALGVTDGELARLAELYAPGTTLWRTPIPHFTPWDCNWPYGPPEDAEEPPEPDAEKPDPDDPETEEEQDDDEPAEDEEDPACEQGSVIECENQVLGETIPLVGTPQSLHYRSNRVSGRRIADTMKVRLSGRSIPASLARIELRIDVAGRRIRRTFAAAPNQTFTYTWDRTDVYGRHVQGRHPVTVQVGYVYPAVYYEPADLPSSFAAVSSRTSVATNREALEVILWRRAHKRLGASDATLVGLGGWTLTDHHLYHPAPRSRELYYGDGDREVGEEPASVELLWNSATDTSGIPGRRLGGPYALVGAADGGYYTVDSIPQGQAAPFFRVWKVAPDGEKEIALYVSQRLDVPQVTLGPGGDVYVAICDGFVFGRILNLRTGESWSTHGTGCFDHFLVAPDGSFYYGRFELLHRRRDGTTSAVFQAPTLQELGFRTIDPQGAIFVSVRSTNRVWRIDPDGSSRVVAGTGVRGFSGDGGPATAAQLNFPQELEVAPDGSLLILDALNHRVRRVDRSGTIHTVLGSGSTSSTVTPTPPLAAGLSFSNHLALTPDGRILVQDRIGIDAVIRQLTYPLPQLTTVGDTAVLSKDGDEVFVFDPRGRHLRTLNALTGATERTMGYDSDGRLASITDAFGNQTRVERDASGAPTAIVDPYGQRTTLDLNPDGYLASVTNPAGESHELEYGPGGLLTSFTDPERHEDTFEYSPLGRLTEARDAAGGTKTLRRWVSGPGRYRVELTTSEGREVAYSLSREVSGAQHRSTATTGGTTSASIEHRDGSHVVELPSGTSVRTVEGADPQFGLQAPLVRSRRVTTPSGLSMQASFESEATFTSPGDPFSLSSLRATLTVNGREGVELFDATTGEVTSTSPMSRSGVTTLDEHLRPREVRPPGVEELRYEYDSLGRLMEVSQGVGDAERVLTLSYDGRGRVRSVVDPFQRQVQFEYDDADRVVRQTLTDGRAILFGYDRNGNLKSLAPPGQPPHVFRYTPVDAVETYEPPEVDSGPVETTFVYDRDRRLVEVRRPDGSFAGIAYDAAGRLSAVSQAATVVDFSYDPESGQLSSVTEDGTAVSYTYDGSLLARTTWSGSVQGAVERGYDDNFWLRSRSVNGTPVTFDYDDDGLLIRAGELTVIRDSASGRVMGTAIGSTATSASYNGFGELESLESTTGGATLYSAFFHRDLLGRIASKTETIGGVTQTYDYHYGPAGWLERVDRNGTSVEKYRYDDNGNRLAAVYSWGELAATYDDQDRLLTHGDTEFTYSAAGDLTGRIEAGATTTYDYDVFGNLRRVGLPTGDVIEYVIDGRNRRVGRRENGLLTKGFLYKDALHPIAELDGGGAVVSRFVYGGRADMAEYMIKGQTTYRLISDHLGSVRLVVNTETGAIAQRLDYDAFGRTVLDTNPGFQPFGFAGGMYDPLTGLVRFGTRDYDPAVGRWTTKDPILFRGGDTNTYGYLMNDPLNGVDAEGLAQKCSRPLDSAAGKTLGGLYPGAGSSEHLDRMNREPLHEHFWFDDGENFGFFGPTDEKPDGIRPDAKFPREDYRCEGRQYDEETLREAIGNTEPEDYQLLGDDQYNCQDWVSDVLAEYERLRYLRTRATGIDPETEFVWQKILDRN